MAMPWMIARMLVVAYRRPQAQGQQRIERANIMMQQLTLQIAHQLNKTVYNKHESIRHPRPRGLLPL